MIASSLGEYLESNHLKMKRRRSFSSVKADKGSSSGRVRKKLLSTSDSEELDIDMLTSEEMESMSDSTALPDLSKSSKQPHKGLKSHEKKKQAQPVSPKNHLMRSDYGIESNDSLTGSLSSDLNEMITTLKRKRMTSASSSSSGCFLNIHPVKKRSLHAQLSSDSSGEECKERRAQLVLSPHAQLLLNSPSADVTIVNDISYTLYGSSDSSNSDVLILPTQKNQTTGRRKLFLDNSSDQDTSDFENQKFLSLVGRSPVKVTKRKRRRVKKVLDSEDATSSSEDTDKSDVEEVPPTPSKRKDIRKVIPEAKLANETKLAKKAEKERLKRLEDKRKQLAATEEQEKLILELNPESNEVVLEIRESLLSALKPHQREGIKFLFDCCCERASTYQRQELLIFKVTGVLIRRIV